MSKKVRLEHKSDTANKADTDNVNYTVGVKLYNPELKPRQVLFDRLKREILMYYYYKKTGKVYYCISDFAYTYTDRSEDFSY